MFKRMRMRAWNRIESIYHNIDYINFTALNLACRFDMIELLFIIIIFFFNFIV